MQTTDAGWLTPHEAGAILGIGDDKIRCLIATGDITAVDVRRRGAKRASYRISTTAIQSFIASRVIHSQSRAN